MIGRVCILLLASWLAVSPGQAGASPTLQALLDKHAQAIGPVERVQSRRMRLRVVGMAPFDIAVVTEVARPNLIRKEVLVQGSTQVSAFDGRHAWKIDPFVAGGDKPVPMPALEAKALIAEAGLDGTLTGHAAKGVKLAYKGPAVVDGKPSHALGVTLADGSAATIWLDAVSYLEVKRTQMALVMGAMQPVDITSSDYRLVDGVRIAHRMESRLAGAPDKITIIIDAVSLNVKIDPARFARPAIR